MFLHVIYMSYRLYMSTCFFPVIYRHVIYMFLHMLYTIIFTCYWHGMFMFLLVMHMVYARYIQYILHVIYMVCSCCFHMLCTWFTHVIYNIFYMLFTWCSHVIYMLFTCYTYIYTCCIHVIYMLYICCIHVAYMLYTCLIMLYRYVPLAECLWLPAGVAADVPMRCRTLRRANTWFQTVRIPDHAMNHAMIPPSRHRLHWPPKRSQLVLKKNCTPFRENKARRLRWACP